MARRDLVPPQLVVNSRMLYFGWIPEDPDAVARLGHPRLNPAANRQVFMSQYVVDSDDQTTGFGAYSLTDLGIDLDRFAPDGITPSRWWTHYINSNGRMRHYARERGVPAAGGRTSLELSSGNLIATTFVDEVPIIRTTAKVGRPASNASGQLSYITDIERQLVNGVYPWVATLVDPWEILSLEFLDPNHSTYALRPSSPLEVTWGFYSPNASFCYPGGLYSA